MNLVLENSVTILIALIAGLVALIQARYNTISSARIRWIEELRTSISKFYECSLNTSMFLEIKTDNKKFIIEEEEQFKLYLKSHSDFYIVATKIRMYLNPQEELHRELEVYIQKVEDYLDPDNKLQINRITQQ